MNIMVDISLYPFQKDYDKEILDFIESLKKDNELFIQTNAMSTQISGDYDKVFNVLQHTIKNQFEKGKSLFVIKITNGC